MTQIRDEVLAANAAYAGRFGTKGQLAMPPARGFAILTCMDARLDPAGYAGLAEGDAHVIRNAGGRASDDAIRSLVISYKLLGTREWFVVHHTDCGMETFTDEVMRRPARVEPEDGVVRAAGLDGPGRRRLARGRVRRLADDPEPRGERRDRRPAHPLAPARSGRDPDPRVRVRREERAASGGGDGGEGSLRAGVVGPPSPCPLPRRGRGRFVTP